MTELGLTLLIISKHLRFIEPWRLNSPSHYTNGHSRSWQKRHKSRAALPRCFLY